MRCAAQSDLQSMDEPAPLDEPAASEVTLASAPLLATVHFLDLRDRRLVDLLVDADGRQRLPLPEIASRSAS